MAYCGRALHDRQPRYRFPGGPAPPRAYRIRPAGRTGTARCRKGRNGPRYRAASLAVEPVAGEEELRARLPVSEVVGKRVKLKKAGREWIGLSPFQQEKSPSFTVNDQKGFYHDFSSGKHGDIISFLIEAEGVGFTEAVERLASTATVLGVFSNWDSEERTVDLLRGDTLVLFSDGVTESGLESGHEFGEDGLLSLIRASQGLDAETLVDRVVRAVSGDRQDDVTVVAIRGV